eukprot:3378919-Lingulodinium_polyedra.AAC.1
MFEAKQLLEWIEAVADDWRWANSPTILEPFKSAFDALNTCSKDMTAFEKACLVGNADLKTMD